jgi:hypothetical protein
MFYQRIFLTIIATAALVAASAQQLTVTLTGSMHNGSSIPCFGKKVGNITSTVTGGAAPYTYDWSNGETTPSITGVSAGYYSVNVKDANGTEEKAEITLTEPEELKVTATVSSFANGHNISCFECNNGYIQVSATQGTPPYSYAWSDGPSTAQNRYALGPKAYKVTVTDANGCESSTSVTITQPERSDWTMNGNAGTNPATQYIGTSDNKDVVFKANGQESLRLKANGGISLLGDLVGTGPVIRDSDGSLRLGGDENLPVIGTNDCYTRNQMPYWNSTGNAFGQVCPDFIPRLGTLTPVDLDLITNGQSRMVISSDGKVAIGQVSMPSGYRLYVQEGILTERVKVAVHTEDDWEDRVFAPGYNLMPLPELKRFLERERHLPDVPSAAEMVSNGLDVAKSDAMLLKQIEQLYLHIIALQERIVELENAADPHTPKQ